VEKVLRANGAAGAIGKRANFAASELLISHYWGFILTVLGQEGFVAATRNLVFECISGCYTECFQSVYLYLLT
jgi:hypothetical protein